MSSTELRNVKDWCDCLNTFQQFLSSLTNYYNKYQMTMSIVPCSRVYLTLHCKYLLLCWFSRCHEICDSHWDSVLMSWFCCTAHLCRSDCLRLCYYWAKWRLYLIIIGGKDAGHSCVLPYRLGCFESTSKCGGDPTQWLPVTTSFCLSKTVKITAIILSLLWE